MATTKPSTAARKAASPKTTATPSVAKTANVAVKSTEYRIKHKIDSEAQPSTFVMSSGGGIIYKLASDITIYDKETGAVRQIRYCPNEPSIYVDEQSEHAVREHVLFRDKILFVPVEKPNLLEFMVKHTGNKVNGGSIFQLIDKGRTAEEELEKEFDQYAAVAMVRDKDLSELLPVAMYLGINTDRKSAEIRRDLLQDAKKNPNRFVQLFDNPQVKCKSAVLQAIDFQLLLRKQDGMYWFDNNRIIVSAAAGLDPVEVMTRFCLTEKGADVYDRILEFLSKL